MKEFKWIRADLPAYGYVNELMRDNYPNITDLSLLEFSAGISLIFDGDMSNEHRKAQELLQGVMKNLADAQYQPGHELMQPPWGLMLYSDLLDAVSDHDRNILQNVAFALLYGRDANGWSIRHDSGDIIVLDVVMSPLLSYLNQMMFLCRQKATLGQNELSVDWFFQVIMPHLLFFIDDFPTEMLPKPRAENMGALALRKIMTNNQIMFLIAHEMGHTVLNHNGYNFKVLAARPGFDCSKSSSILHYDRNHKMEFEADEYAARLCFKAAIEKLSDAEKSDKEAVYYAFATARSAIELLFIYMAAIEETAKEIKRLVYRFTKIFTNRF